MSDSPSHFSRSHSEVEFADAKDSLRREASRIPVSAAPNSSLSGEVSLVDQTRKTLDPLPILSITTLVGAGTHAAAYGMDQWLVSTPRLLRGTILNTWAQSSAAEQTFGHLLIAHRNAYITYGRSVEGLAGFEQTMKTCENAVTKGLGSKWLTLNNKIHDIGWTKGIEQLRQTDPLEMFARAERDLVRRQLNFIRSGQHVSWSALKGVIGSSDEVAAGVKLFVQGSNDASLLRAYSKLAVYRDEIKEVVLADQLAYDGLQKACRKMELNGVKQVHGPLIRYLLAGAAKGLCVGAVLVAAGYFLTKTKTGHVPFAETSVKFETRSRSVAIRR